MYKTFHIMYIILFFYFIKHTYNLLCSIIEKDDYRIFLMTSILLSLTTLCSIKSLVSVKDEVYLPLFVYKVNISTIFTVLNSLIQVVLLSSTFLILASCLLFLKSSISRRIHLIYLIIS